MAEILINAFTILFSPVLFLVIGLLIKKNPPKEINRTVGFRTKLSMESQEAWDYANKQIGIYWVRVGVIELVISIIVLVAIMLFPVGSFVTERFIAVFVMVIEILGAMIPVNMINKELINMKNK